MFERFTDRARRVVVQAQDEAKTHDHDYLGPEHLLLSLTHENIGGLAAKTLESLGIDLALRADRRDRASRRRNRNRKRGRGVSVLCTCDRE
jgi:ATP-dependent Clp protease ATP-binding subunit ClpA